MAGLQRFPTILLMCAWKRFCDMIKKAVAYYLILVAITAVLAFAGMLCGWMYYSLPLFFAVTGAVFFVIVQVTRRHPKRLQFYYGFRTVKLFLSAGLMAMAYFVMEKVDMWWVVELAVYYLVTMTQETVFFVMENKKN